MGLMSQPATTNKELREMLRNESLPSAWMSPNARAFVPGQAPTLSPTPPVEEPVVEVQETPKETLLPGKETPKDDGLFYLPKEIFTDVRWVHMRN